MEKHTFTAKMVCAMVGAILVSMLIIATGFAASESVVPNFTALKVGNVLTSTVSDGTIVASGSITAGGTVTGDSFIATSSLKVGNYPSYPAIPITTGNIRASGTITADTAIKTASILPSSSTVTLTGNLDVTGDVTADSIGAFYTVNSYCTGTCTENVEGGYYEMTVSCDSGDFVMSCQGSSSWDAVESKTFASDEDSCWSGSSEDDIYLQAICFSPDGGDGDSFFGITTGTSIMDNPGFVDFIERDLTNQMIDIPLDWTQLLEDLAHAEAEINEMGALLDSYISGPSDIEVQTMISDYLTTNGYATETWVTGRNFATQAYVGTYVGTRGYATQTWVTSKGYATQTSVDSLTTSVTSLQSSVTTLQTDVSGLKSARLF